MDRTKAFISYSQKDELWKDRLMVNLAVLEFEGLLHVWADTRLSAGEAWYESINNAMDYSRVAVLLVSPDFLASKFIRNEEVPRLLQLHQENGMLILPLIARPAAWKLVPWLSQVQVRPKFGKPLSMGTDNEIDADLTNFTYEVASLLNRFTPQPSTAVLRAYSDLESKCKSIESVDEQAMGLILTTAIDHGAPAYNEGSPLDCARIYRYAANRLVELIQAGKSSGNQTHSTPSVQQVEGLLSSLIPPEDSITTENADQLAWTLRRAFDRILARRGERNS
jgi:hypothetical protein